MSNDVKTNPEDVRKLMLQSMFQRLVSVGSYSETEAQNILLTKSPKDRELIINMKKENTMEKETVINEEAVEVNPKPTKAKAKTKAKKESNLHRARELYAKFPNQERKECVAMFVEKLNIPASTASTYHWICKNK